MGKFLSLLLVLVSVLVLLHAATIYKRSYFLESTDRVDLQRLIDNIGDLERPALVDLSRRLVTISRSDHGILLILNQEFRGAILYLSLCLIVSLSALSWLIIRAQLPGQRNS